MPFIIGLIGLLIGGALAYFFFQNKLQQIQRKLESSEKKLERANRALEDTESLRSQQAVHAQELQNARQQVQSVEASYQGQLRNLEESYELQLQEVEKLQGNPAAIVDSKNQIRQIEQSYQAQIQELQANHHNEKVAIEQSYQAQIRELQESHQQTLEEIQRTPPVQAFDTSSPTSPERTESGGWPGAAMGAAAIAGAAMGAAAIAGAAGLAGWATSSFLNREDEEPPVVEETSEESVAESPFEIPDETPEENWADQPVAEEEVAIESEMMGWTEPALEEASEEPVTESPFEVPDEIPEDNWADASLGEDLLEGADLSSWTESEPATVSGEITEELAAESPFEIPDETPEDNWTDQPLAEEVAIESGMMGWTETSPVIEEATEGLVTESPFGISNESPEESVSESPFESPELTIEENWVDTAGEDDLLSGMDLSAWTDSPPAAIADEFTEELSLVETSEELVAEAPVEVSEDIPGFALEENWVDTPSENDLFGETELASWTDAETFPLLEEPLQSLEETFETPDISFDLGESFDSPVEAELPFFENAEALSETSTDSELDFLSMLQTDEPSLGESEELSSFMDMEEPGLPDFLGEETLNDDLQLLDMFPPETEDLANMPEILTGDANAPFINFFDSESEKSDLEFLEMLKTDDDDLNRLASNESDDLFGDLFTPDDSPSPDINDLFNSVESQKPKASQEGLEDLFGDDTISFDNWDLPSPDKPSVD